ncbi:MAG: protein kinase, partial [Gemmatimonadales bacterium]
SVGTPAYMSPEQCTGDEVVPASDQYGLGVIAYEMLTGKRPYGGATSVALMFGHAHGTAEPIESLRSDCPPRLAAAVMRMLAKRPEDRWPSLEAAIQAIGGVGYRADDQTRSQLVQLARTGQVMKLVAKANTPRSPLPTTRSKEHPAQPAAVAKPSRWPLLVAGAVAVLGIGSTGYLLLNRAPEGAPTQVEPAPAPPPAAAETVPPAATPEPEPTAASAPSRPRHESPAASVRAPAPPPAPSPTPPAPPVRETAAVPPPAAAGRDSAAAAADSVSSGLAQVIAGRPAESAASVQAPPPAPEVVSQAEPAIVVDQRQVTQVVRRYAAALESGNMAAVRQAFPGMPEAQRQGLQSFFGAGGTLATSWTIGMPEINGAAATVRVVGSNRLTLPRSSPTTESVTLNVRLSRQLTGWRIVAID